MIFFSPAKNRADNTVLKGTRMIGLRFTGSSDMSISSGNGERVISFFLSDVLGQSGLIILTRVNSKCIDC